MPVVPALSVSIPSGSFYYRITPTTYRTGSARLHRNVVNGQGALTNPYGARYNYPGAVTVYLTETVGACLAEKMYYFQREILTALSVSHLPHGIFPAFQQSFVLWEITFTNAIPNVFDLSVMNASAQGVFPCLMLNPAQDYDHLKQQRAAIQSNHYLGLRAPLTRDTAAGNMVVLF